MRIPPAEVLITFPQPNYTNPETRGPALVIINGVFIGIAVISVALRTWTRVFITRLIGWDDIFCLFSLFFTIGLTVAVLLANQQYHWNRHVWDVPFTFIPQLGKIAFAAKILFTLAATFIRFSLMCFYYRLVGDSGLKSFRFVVHGAMAFNLLVCLSFILLTTFQCRPVSSYWVFPPTGSCLDEGKVMLGSGIINCFADLLVTILPIPMIMNLKMRLRQKLAVVFLLSLGFTVTIAGVLRTYFIWKSLVASWDETWYAYPLWIAAAVEIDLAVITACAPALRPFFSIYFGPLLQPISILSKHFGSTEGSSRPTKTGKSTTGSRTLDQISKDVTIMETEIEMKATFYHSDPAESESRLPIVKADMDETDAEKRQSSPRQSHRSPTSSLFSRMSSKRGCEPISSPQEGPEDNTPLRIYRRQSFQLSTTTSPRSQSPFSPINDPTQQPRTSQSRERGHTVPGGSSSRRPSDEWPLPSNGIPDFLQRGRSPDHYAETAGIRSQRPTGI